MGYDICFNKNLDVRRWDQSRVRLEPDLSGDAIIQEEGLALGEG